MASILNATTSSGLVTSADNSGSLQLATNNGTTAVTIDTSQNVGIGTASPISNGGYGGLSLNGTSGALFSMMTNGTESGRIASLGDETSVQCKASTGYINFVQGVSGGTVRGRFDSAGNFQYNSGYGSVATAFGCRAWVNFVGTGTPTIQASGNVSSLTDLGAGHYNVNFSNALPDTLFTAFNTADIGGWTAGRNQIAGLTTSGYECRFWNSSNTSTDPSLVVTAVIR
jgi:hypothetical protein